jgi:hypothetical protein
MAAHRHRPRRRKPPSGPPKGVYKGAISEGGDLEAAAAIIAGEASRIARANGMPETADSVSVYVEGGTAIIYSDAPAAYPNEVEGVRHPVFGGRGTSRPDVPWVLNEHRPFLGPAMDAKAASAAARYAQKVDRLLAKAGFK